MKSLFLTLAIAGMMMSAIAWAQDGEIQQRKENQQDRSNT